MSEEKKTSSSSPPQDPGDGHWKFFAAFLILIPAFVFGPWLNFQLSVPQFPPMWVRPSSFSDKHVCRNLDQISAPDPYSRPAHYLDPPVQKLQFCEAADEIPGTGKVLISCDPSRDQWNTVMGSFARPTPRGALWIYDYFAGAEAVEREDPTSVQPKLVKLRDYPEHFDFHPLAMSTWEEGDETRLFVVNHRRRYNTVEVFTLQQQEEDWVATYVRTLQHGLGTHTANGIAATSKNSVLVTQDHLFPARPPPLAHIVEAYTPIIGATLAPFVAKIAASPLASQVLPKVETVLGLPLSYVAHLTFLEGTGQQNPVVPADEPTQEALDASVASEGVTARVVDRWIPFANGVAISPNATTVAIASTMAPNVRLFHVALDSAGKPDWTANKPLQLYSKVWTPMGADNLAFTPVYQQAARDLFDGAALVVGGHPSGLRLLKMVKDPHKIANAAPSWVVYITPESRWPYSTEAKDGDITKQATTRDAAPVSSGKRNLINLRAWNIRTLYQAEGQPVQVAQVEPETGREVGRRSVGVPSSSGGFWDPTDKGKGTLLVTGLYHTVLACTEVGLGER